MATITLTSDNSAFPHPPKDSKIHITNKVPKNKTKMVLDNFKGHRGMGDIIINFYSGRGSLVDIKFYDAGHQRQIPLSEEYESYFISLNPNVIYPSEELAFDLQFV
ncbi:MAG: hypothetical protein WDM71_03600 [Ferruginibacter sp.]